MKTLTGFKMIVGILAMAFSATVLASPTPSSTTNTTPSGTIILAAQGQYGEQYARHHGRHYNRGYWNGYRGGYRGGYWRRNVYWYPNRYYYSHGKRCFKSCWRNRYGRIKCNVSCRY
ncbi:hypothetical protein [Legionella spiritensis]|uniref:Glycine-rich protein n=1 Tax=Legionella spiritensis TaxID=452 RepID=A0A0W0Z6W3_LEGSP|nr:hypothetical protein [Legionella spiritensis]KTD64857.1 hypothetical protein Lspi_1024 [Legionella spiritensis]SNV40924.1 Uncharacterised protein [Legionella spiritensis]